MQPSGTWQAGMSGTTPLGRGGEGGGCEGNSGGWRNITGNGARSCGLACRSHVGR